MEFSHMSYYSIYVIAYSIPNSKNIKKCFQHFSVKYNVKIQGGQMHQQIAAVNNFLSLNWRFSSRNLSIGILQVATLSLPPLLIFPLRFFFERALRGDVKNGSFCWCPPQSSLI